jgi:hypothetical protein
MRDPIFSGWVLKDMPKYRSMFDESNAWTMDQYVKGFLDHRQAGDPMCRVLYYNPLLNLTVNSPLTDLPDYVRKEAVCVHSLPHMESSYGVYKVFPNGSILYTMDLGSAYVEGFRSIADLFWDPDKDRVTMNVYLCNRSYDESEAGEHRPWCKPFGSDLDFFNSLYYSKLIYGSISEEDFSVIGGGSNTSRRYRYTSTFAQVIDLLVRKGQPNLLDPDIDRELVVENGRFTCPKANAKAEGAFEAWTRAGGYALANSIDFSLYLCDHNMKATRKDLSIKLRSV